ncbi:ABC transporter substrate-binding protein [Solicola gregarius]|uniref:ABC transporter substrate-binding protein n=1 Tax=Solicola gregarius TaxID=2908642 RepID=A0AA46TII6_9ACTN|nr:ABC transporter substrate-binding protein [Solicola gregarius]UYM05153.1 ABC transporter substrate-binding protein [Solicola gregarius]
MTTIHPVRTFAAVACTAALVVAGCTKSEDSGASDTPADPEAGAQKVKAAGTNGPECTLDKYGAEKLDLADATVGFSQSEKEDNPFRIAETESITTSAEEAGVKDFIKTNAQTQLSKQISDIQGMISQGVDVLIVAPLNSDGLEPALNAAKDKGIPVLTVDRKLNAAPCDDYISFLGSDFTEQGKRAADQVIESTDGKANVAILLGASGNNVTTERTKGFVDQVEAEAPDIEIVAQQTGEFARDKGQQVTEQLLQSNPEIDTIYAENDEMGLGALAAIRAAGKQPGEDVKIFSVDGTRNAVLELTKGTYNGVIESNPRFGPLAFDTLEKFYAGDPVTDEIVIEDREYNPDNAEELLDSAY